MKKILVTSILSCIVSSSALSADSNFYGRFDVGAVYAHKIDNEHDFKADYDHSLSAGLGYNFSNDFRVEINLTNSNIRNKDSDLVSMAINSVEILPKIYFDIIKFDKMAAYIGAGFGYSHHSIAGTQEGDEGYNLKKSNYVISGTIGISYNISDNTKVNFAYEYKQYKKVDLYKPKTHSATLGLQFSF